MSEGRIEESERLRDEQPPDDSMVVIRGGPDTTRKLTTQNMTIDLQADLSTRDHTGLCWSFLDEAAAPP